MLQESSLISVIITCYNHGVYLANAIESILSQSYKNYEIIMVDDGSTDNTKVVTEMYPGVKYVYQPNQGLSAARNKGIDNSRGKYLTFLDADDWFLPDAFQTNLKYIELNNEIAFVSGAHELFYEPENKRWIVQKDVNEMHYCHLLEKNYIGMHATVLFKRWVFDEFRYDTTLKSCEDYDLYLKIARKYAIISHIEMIAVYRFHDNNMSGNYLMMLESALLVLKRQKKFLISKVEKQWYKKGIRFWQSYYSEKMFEKAYMFLVKGEKVSKDEVKAIKRYNLVLYYKFITGRYSDLKLGLGKKMISIIKKLLPHV